MIDKTGTLTVGKPLLTAIVPAEGFNEAILLQLTANLEKASEHPLAAAFLAAAKDKKVELFGVETFQSVRAKG